MTLQPDAPPPFPFLNLAPQHPPTPAEQAAQLRFDQAAALEDVRHRRAILYWAAIYCTCPPAYQHLRLDGPPPHGHCVVHGALMLHPQTGRVIM